MRAALLSGNEWAFNHTEAAVRLYLQETFTFPLLTTEAAVVLVPPGK